MNLFHFRRNAQYNTTTTIQSYQHHAASSSSANAASSMQLMPYTAQTKPLNPDELSKLYSMNQFGRPMLPSNMLNFPNIQTGIGGLGQQQIQSTNIANPMSLAQANANSAQFLTNTPYLQQGRFTFTHWTGLLVQHIPQFIQHLN